MIRLILVLALLSVGCSFVNSTDDLRNSDASVSADTEGPPFDGGPLFDAGPFDGAMFDGGPDVLLDVDAALPDAPDAGPDCPLPNIDSIEVRVPTYPPQLVVVFGSAVSCARDLTVTGPAEVDGVLEVYMMRLEAGDMVATFDYTGPRVPLFDEEERVRVFTAEVDSGGPANFDVSMPVERLQMSESGPSDFEFETTPHVDIADDGTVVFESNDSSLGPMSGSSNVFVWTTVPTRTGGVLVSNIEQYFVDDGSEDPPAEPLVAPVISDDGLAIAYLQLVVGSPPVATFQLRDGVGKQAIIGGIYVAGERHLDLRNTGSGEYIVLVRGSGATGEPGVGNFVYQRSSTSQDFAAVVLPFRPSGGGTLIVPGTTNAGYAAVEESVVIGVTSPDDVYTDSCDAVSSSFAHIYMDAGEVRLATRCGDKLSVDGMPLDVDSLEDGSDWDVDSDWRLIDVSANHEQILVRHRTGGTNTPYLLFNLDKDEQRTVALDGFGNTRTERLMIHDTLFSAALSPNGEWLVYTLVPDTGDRMEIYRIPVDTEITTPVPE